MSFVSDCQLFVEAYNAKDTEALQQCCVVPFAIYKQRFGELSKNAKGEVLQILNPMTLSKKELATVCTVLEKYKPSEEQIDQYVPFVPTDVGLKGKYLGLTIADYNLADNEAGTYEFMNTVLPGLELNPAYGISAVDMQTFLHVVVATPDAFGSYINKYLTGGCPPEKAVEVLYLDEILDSKTHLCDYVGMSKLTGAEISKMFLTTAAKLYGEGILMKAAISGGKYGIKAAKAGEDVAGIAANVLGGSIKGVKEVKSIKKAMSAKEILAAKLAAKKGATTAASAVTSEVAAAEAATTAVAATTEVATTAAAVTETATTAIAATETATTAIAATEAATTALATTEAATTALVATEAATTAVAATEAAATAAAATEAAAAAAGAATGAATTAAATGAATTAAAAEATATAGALASNPIGWGVAATLAVAAAAYGTSKAIKHSKNKKASVQVELDEIEQYAKEQWGGYKVEDKKFLKHICKNVNRILLCEASEASQSYRSSCYSKLLAAGIEESKIEAEIDNIVAMAPDNSKSTGADKYAIAYKFIDVLYPAV